ncbi:MAG: magnesium-translocating P-type ATPase [Chloroflexi bacterium]|nr:magnesium-translocating P-type ATPase [Chloroflexota bacterium]
MKSETRTFWSVAVQDMLAQLDAHADGLSSAEVERQRLRHGSNIPGKSRAHPRLRLLWNQFKSPLVLLLLFAMSLSYFLGEVIDASVVLLVVVASAVLGFAQEYRAGDAVAKLLAAIRLRTFVLRDGVKCDVDIEEIVPGDVLLLGAGAVIPADCVLIEERDLFVDEAALTGESYPAEKHVGIASADAPPALRSNALFQGTHVISGSAHALVVHTGADTEFGAIRERLQSAAPITDFERGIQRFGSTLMQLTLVLVLLLFAVNVYFHKPPIDSFLFALALAVGITPELLPVIVSVTLARGAQRMAKRRVIVKRLTAIENLGSMDVLCSDKTGTLTEGRMRLHGAIDVNGAASARTLLFAHLNASFESGFVNPIDAALRAGDGLDERQVAEISSARARYHKLDEIPYDFVRRRLSVAVECADDGTRWMITKGAFDNVLQICSDVEIDGSVHTLLDEMRARVQDLLGEHSRAGLRVLAVAARPLGEQQMLERTDEVGLTLLGLLLFEDPLKAGIGDTIAEMEGLGVSLKLLTGDNRFVSESVMRHIGWASPRVLTGSEMRHLGDAALAQRVDSVDVFAEVEPDQKERILLALRRAGHVVGYMGDGINDAAALHIADVGISVDSAVDVAKEAADVVLLEHGLDVLVQGVRDGRATFANTMKYIFITTSANFGNMLSMATVSIGLPFLPLLPKQILLNNFLSDLPSLTIATDRVDPELVARPRRWDIALIRRFMFAFGLVSSVFDLVTFGFLLFVMHAGEHEFQTGWFIESLMTELMIVLVIRTRWHAWRSRPGGLLSVVTLIVAGATILLPYSPLGPLFGLVPLPAGVMLVLIGITLAYMLASEITKHIVFGKND